MEHFSQVHIWCNCYSQYICSLRWQFNHDVRFCKPQLMSAYTITAVESHKIGLTCLQWFYMLRALLEVYSGVNSCNTWVLAQHVSNRTYVCLKIFITFLCTYVSVSFLFTSSRLHATVYYSQHGDVLLVKVPVCVPLFCNSFRISRYIAK